MPTLPLSAHTLPRCSSATPRDMPLAAFPKCYLDALLTERSMTLEDWIELAARELELDGLELYTPLVAAHTPGELRGVREQMEQRGLRMPMLCHSLVLGPGPIGLLCARIAALAGARPLSVAGTPADAARLEVARRLGATDAVDVTSADVRDALWSATDGHGYDVVVDATGASAALELALEQVRPAGTIVKVGWGPQPLGFSLDLLVAKAATLQGSFSHTWTTWERVLRLQATGQLALDELVGGIWPLERWHDGFAAMLSGDAVKSVLTPTGAR